MYFNKAYNRLRTREVSSVVGVFIQQKITIKSLMFSFWIFTAPKRSLRRFCFHRCLSVHGGCLHPGGSVSRGLYRGGLHPGGPASGGSTSRGGLHPGGGVGQTPHPTPPDTTGYGQRVGDMHPTGMYSCSFSICSLFYVWCTLTSKLFVQPFCLSKCPSPLT